MTSIDGLARRVMELGLGNKTFSASHALFFRDQDYSNVVLCGLPGSVFYHEDYLEMCHQVIEKTASEVQKIFILNNHFTLTYFRKIISNSVFSVHLLWW